MKIMRYILIALLLVFLLLVETFQSQVLVLALLFAAVFPLLRIRDERIIARKKQIQWGVLGLLAVVFIFAFPKRSPSEKDRTKNLYMNDAGEEIAQPLFPYLLNIVPEAEILKIVMAAARFTPWSLMPVPGPAKTLHIMELQRTADVSFSKNIFLREYERVYDLHENAGCATPLQALQTMGMYSATRQFYLTLPLQGKSAKPPLVIFLHGLMGNWQAYYSFMGRLDECAVACIGTKGLSGIFSAGDIKGVKHKILPLIRKRVDYDADNVHIIGLSNGGSGVAAAALSEPGLFKTFTYISCRAAAGPAQRVFLIGGSRDPALSAGISLPGNRLILPNEGHFVILNRTNEVINFIRRYIRTGRKN